VGGRNEERSEEHVNRHGMFAKEQKNHKPPQRESIKTKKGVNQGGGSERGISGRRPTRQKGRVRAWPQVERWCRYEGSDQRSGV